MFLLSFSAFALDGTDAARVRTRLATLDEPCADTRAWVISTLGADCPGVPPGVPEQICIARLVNTCQYPDPDGDGYTRTYDCDETDPTIYWGAPDTCHDGIDQSCDGSDACDEGEFTTIMPGPGCATYEPYLGGFPTAVGDFDNDGVDDIAAGHPYCWEDGVPGHLRVYDGPIEPGMSSTASVHLAADARRRGLGYSLVSADLNLDGVDDLVAGTPYGDYIGLGAGTVVAYLGPVTAGSPELEIYFPTTWSAFGETIAVADDLTGDGVPDLVSEDREGGYGGWRGFDGDLTGFVSASVASFVITADVYDGDYYSGYRSLAAVGDVNGDGQDDLAVGAPKSGELGVFFGPLSGTYARTAADVTWLVGADDENLRTIEAPGDMDADGHADVVTTTADATWLLTEPSAGTHDLATTAAASFTELGTDGRSGAVLAADFDGDDARDLWISGVYVGTSYGEGTAAVYAGPLAGTYASADAARFWEGSHGYAMLGIDADLLGDTDGDGREDLLTQVEAIDGADGNGEFLFVPGSLLP